MFMKSTGSIMGYIGHFRTTEVAKPIYMRPEQVPYALKEKVEQELARLELCEIITKVEHSVWGTLCQL